MAKEQNDFYQHYRQKQNREIETLIYKIADQLGRWAGYYIWKGTKKSFNFLKNKLKRGKNE
jgi:hypothetical protein